MAKSKKYTLTQPATVGTGEDAETITEVTITRKLQYLRGVVIKAGMDGSGGMAVNIDIGQSLDLATKMIGHPLAVLDAMEDEDQAYILEQANDFLFSSLGNGKAA